MCCLALGIDTASVSVQFLPQDKVVEFAKLKPVDLLLETEKAVGDSTLHGKHEKLIEERKELHRLEQVSFFRDPISRSLQIGARQQSQIASSSNRC